MLLRAIATQVIGQLGQLALQLLALALYSVNLTKDECGIGAVYATVITLITALTEFGLGSYVVKVGEKETTLCSLRRLSAVLSGVGAVAALGYFACLPARFLDGKSFALIAVPVAVSMQTLCTVPAGVLWHRRRYAVLGGIACAGILIGSVCVGTWMALWGCGGLAVPIGMLVSAVVRLGLLQLAAPVPFGTFNKSDKNLWIDAGKFCFPLAIACVANAMVMYGDKLVLILSVSPQKIAVFDRAAHAMLAVSLLVGNTLDAILYPRCLTMLIENKERRKAQLVAAFGGFMAVSVAFSTLVWLCAQDIVLLVLGSEWQEVGDVLSVLILAVPLNGIARFTDCLLRANSATTVILRNKILGGFFMIAILFFGAQGSLIMAAWSVVVARLLLAVASLVSQAEYLPWRDLRLTSCGLANTSFFLLVFCAHRLPLYVGVRYVPGFLHLIWCTLIVGVCFLSVGVITSNPLVSQLGLAWQRLRRYLGGLRTRLQSGKLTA